MMRLSPSYPFLTPRLLLRPLRETDVESLVAYRSLPEVCRFVPFEPMDTKRVREMLVGPWARTTLEAEGETLTLGVEVAESGEVVGDVSLTWSSAEHRAGEIGYVFNPRHGGHGYATEAAHGLLHLAFDELGLHRVIARLDVENVASARVAQRLGMRLEAHLLENEWFNGRWGDEFDYAILEREWQEMHRLAPVAGATVEACLNHRAGRGEQPAADRDPSQ